ncbi:MAG: enoyl-CoA hydratase/isomerase family protein [Pseudomonadota bacterium]
MGETSTSRQIAPDGDISIAKENAAGMITLTRPRALNALTDAMRTAIADALPRFANDPIVYALVIRSGSDRAFCAGGDVRELVEMAAHDVSAAHASFGREYRMDWMLECFPKPTVSLINGFVAGSGVGLTLFGTHRVAGEAYAFAMPETAIGLFPDVGVCHHLARMPHEIGTFLGLTGVTIGRGDAIKLDLATHAISAAHFEAIEMALSEARPVDPLLDGLKERALNDPTPVWDRRDAINRIFSGNDVGAILARLEVEATSGSDDAGWAGEMGDLLKARSPLSLAVTLKHLRRAGSLDIRETLIADYHLAGHFLGGHDFHEGVRALLIDKDKAPRWQHAHVGDVAPEVVAFYLSQAPGAAKTGAGAETDGYTLPSRAEMQRLRPGA